MELEAVLLGLVEIEKRIRLKISGVECYIFGSILKDSWNSNDIDILVLYQNEQHISIVRREMEETKTELPLHVSYLTYNEETELNFISRYGAKLVFRT
ncbi:nucleotidyltransferase domain-containing protein [Dyadobacter soli]|uniref:nucleotidyltransferase domain-containing protein n=1 Tax=Dyadobacter soli TaxID=659014 RepID=UPI000B7EB0AC|nr:nucleotidyltransferase domain-containing protein [Dyadobacter soli]